MIHHSQRYFQTGTSRWLTSDEVVRAKALAPRESTQPDGIMPDDARQPCLVDGDRWFNPYEKEMEKAQAICRQECAHVVTCLKVALKFEEGIRLDLRHGVWGALTPFQRFKLEHELKEGSRNGSLQEDTLLRLQASA